MSALLSFVTLLSNNSYNIYEIYHIDAFNNIFNIRGGLSLLSLIYPPKAADFASKLQQMLQVPTTHNAFQIPQNEEVEYRYPPNVIMLLDETFSVEFVLNNTLRNHETAYTVLCESETSATSKLREFWKSGVISAFALVAVGAELQVFGFEPTPDDITVQRKPHIYLVDVFDLHGTHINVSIVDLAPAVILVPGNDGISDGVEGKFMVEVARKFNMRPHFALARDGDWWGWIFPTGATGTVGEVISGYAGFGFGILAITYFRVKVMDQIAGFIPMECVTWAVPKGAGPVTVPWIAMLVTEFSNNTWIAMACSTLAIFLACLVVERLRFGPTLFRIFASSIGSPVDLPLKSSSRILILTWVWASFILAVAYTASMGSKLAVPPTKPDINTFGELLDSNLNIIGYYNTIRLLSSGQHPQIQAIAKRTKLTTTTIKAAFDRLVQKRDTAFMRQSTTFRYNAVVDPNGQEGIHIMKDCAFQYFPSISMKKWSPYFRGAHTVTTRLFESGISAMWGARLMPELPEIPPTTTALGLDRLLGAFAVLGLGLSFALIVFLIEVTYNKLKTHNWLKRGTQITKIYNTNRKEIGWIKPTAKIKIMKKIFSNKY